MWVLGVAMIVLAVLAEMNPPISTTQAPESALEGAIWLSRGSASDWSAPWWSRSRPANRIGWIMSGITLAVGLSLFAGEYFEVLGNRSWETWPLGGPTAWMRDLGIPPRGSAGDDPGRAVPVRRSEPAWPMDPSSIPLHHLGGRCVFAFRPGPVQGDTSGQPAGLPGLLICSTRQPSG